MIDLEIGVRRKKFWLDASIKSNAQVTGLFGRSGCGKTTILNAIAGIIIPHAGRITICGNTFWDARKHIHLPPEKRRVGVVFQENHLFPHLNVHENLLFGYWRTPPAERHLHLEEIVSLLGLEHLLDKGTSELSGGEERRVAIGRALLTSPRLLLLDEPLTGLDRRLRDRILAYLIQLKGQLNLGIIYVSHFFSDLAALSDNMAAIEVKENEDGVWRSQTVKVGPPLEMLKDVGNLAGVGPIETVIRGEVVEADKSLGYATVRANGFEMHVPLEEQTVGTKAFVTLRADEVILSVGQIPKISTRNIWNGLISRIHRFETRTVVEVNVGQKILAEVTEDAVKDLGLEVGANVYALIKTRSLRATALQ